MFRCIFVAALPDFPDLDSRHAISLELHDGLDPLTLCWKRSGRGSELKSSSASAMTGVVRLIGESFRLLAMMRLVSCLDNKKGIFKSRSEVQSALQGKTRQDQLRETDKYGRGRSTRDSYLSCLAQTIVS